MANYDLYADESVKTALKDLANFVNTGTFQNFKASAYDRGESPRFGGDLWFEARRLGEKYAPEYTKAFDGAQKLVDKILGKDGAFGLAAIAGEIYDAYANMEKSVQDRAAELSEALDEKLPALTADLQNQPVPGGKK